MRRAVARLPNDGELLLGKYRVLSTIGQGGMAAVLRARHVDLDEDVAIKCLLPEMMDRTDFVRRFEREGKAAVKLKGKHVARVFDVGLLETGTPCIVMEYLEGADLGAIIDHHGAQDPKVAVDLALQICEALAEAHALGIVHRDIKATNCFISQPPNEAPVLKVLDFGIATAPQGNTSDLTTTQSIVGTPAYMAPEQMRAAVQADARSDIWSLGVVLYELLEGERPFRSEVYSDLCLKVGMDPPEPMVAPGVSDGLRAVVMKCLEKQLDQRYQTVAELAYDLMPFASEPAIARLAVEQCARHLGRRLQTTPLAPRGDGTRTPSSPSSPRVPHGEFDENAPTKAVPPRLTPVGSQPIVRPDGISVDESHAGPSKPSAMIPAVVGGVATAKPSAMIPATPPRRRRGLVIGTALVATLAVGGGAIYVATRDGHTAPAAAAAQQPSVQHEAPAVAPTPPPPAPPPVAPEATVAAEVPALVSPSSWEFADPPAPKPKAQPARPSVPAQRPAQPKPPTPPPDDLYTRRR